MSSSGYPALTLASWMAREIAFFSSAALPAFIVTVNNGMRVSLRRVGVTKAIDAQFGDDQSECHRQHDDERGRAVDDNILQQTSRGFGAECDQCQKAASHPEEEYTRNERDD